MMKSGKLWIPTRNIWVPRRTAGFISPGIVGAIAGSRRRSSATAVTRVQSVSGSSQFSAGPNTAFGSNVTAGNILVVGIQWTAASNTSISSVTDSLGNTYTISAASKASQASTTHFANGIKTQFAYCTSASSGANTITVTLSNAEWANVNILELTAGSFDQTSTGTGTGTAQSAGSLTTPSNGCYAVCVTANDNGVGASRTTTGSGWTQLQDVGIGTWEMFAEYRTVTTAGSVTGNATAFDSGQWAASLITFKP